MSSRPLTPLPILMAAVPVVLVIGFSLLLSVLSLRENWRFAASIDSVLSVVEAVQTIAAQQDSFARTPGEDLWAALARAGHSFPEEKKRNPWHYPISIGTSAPAVIQLETEIPSQDCQRLSTYFLNRPTAETGLLAIQARGSSVPIWSTLYATSTPQMNKEVSPWIGCGHTATSRLVLIFSARKSP